MKVRGQWNVSFVDIFCPFSVKQIFLRTVSLILARHMTSEMSQAEKGLAQHLFFKKKQKKTTKFELLQVIWTTIFFRYVLLYAEFVLNYTQKQKFSQYRHCVQ